MRGMRALFFPLSLSLTFVNVPHTWFYTGGNYQLLQGRGAWDLSSCRTQKVLTDGVDLFDLSVFFLHKRALRYALLPTTEREKEKKTIVFFLSSSSSI